MRVQRDDGQFETIELPQAVAAEPEKDAPREPGLGGLEPTFA